MTMSRDAAEKTALDCLTWLAGNDDLLPVFMGATGLSTDDLRDAATAPEFLGAVLDFVMMDDAWVIAFCDSRGLAYEVPMQARAALPGGEQVHWT
ncbi:DUF3572 family protein [Pseudooceanicola sediminis]|uniref:DUF3572 family protein n=1 Tax=Pseudooceanicola sediminis TaxID=2211117 RepID=A0A399J9B1_9RHOB|nr:DUF3572 domain-containing protein [Pseudooceanicola sediminis]KAA2316322.1 DUF3572 family protein [Puniceibacterium sp. HSS470]RII39236.1 DUF3572 family protein [Pseudooceanicola sediminis]|tara:strand:+ start:35800 stop:36084 length:285 start_codon:yes stop_codon:yes gene_type:complete